MEKCPPAPVEGCTAGPWKEPIDPRIPREISGRAKIPTPENLVPVTVFVNESELEAWMEEEDYYTQVEEVGMMGEYDNFPKTSGCKRGPFDPECS